MAMAMRALPPLSVAAALILGGNGAFSSSCESPPNQKDDTVEEPFTGIEFPRFKEDYLLVGTAVRCMLGQCKFAKARAYAVGLYVEDGNQSDQWISKDIRNPLLSSWAVDIGHSSTEMGFGHLVTSNGGTLRKWGLQCPNENDGLVRPSNISK
eukprot:Gb_30628 [translate_table: standard]